MLVTNRLLFTATAPFSSDQREVCDSVAMLDEKKLSVRPKKVARTADGRSGNREAFQYALSGKSWLALMDQQCIMYLDSALLRCGGEAL